MSWGASIAGVASTIARFDDIGARWGGDTAYIVGPSAEYAVSLELGSSSHPPYPFVRPAVEDYQRNPEQFVARNTETSLGSLTGMDDLVRTVAYAMARQIQVNANATGSSDGPTGKRSPGTHPAHPQMVTGNLVGGVNVVKTR